MVTESSVFSCSAVVEREVEVGQLHALRHCGGAGGEDQHRRLVLVDVDEDLVFRRALDQGVQALEALLRPLERDDLSQRRHFGPHGGDEVQIAVASEQQHNLRGVEHEAQLVALGAVVDRHEAGAEPGAGVVDLDELRRVGRHDGDAVAGTHAQRLQRVRQLVDARGHLLVGDARLAVAGDERLAVREDGAADRQELSRIHTMVSL
jgi:hypothetical protein